MSKKTPAARPEATEATNFQSHLLDQAQTALVALDRAGHVTHWNRYAEVLYGFPARDTEGADFRQLLIPVTERGSFESVFAKVLQGETWEGDVKLTTSRAAPVDVHVTYSPLVGPSDDVIGLVAVSFDITERRKAERRLAASHEVSKILAEADQIYEAAPRLLQAVCIQLDWSFGALWQVDRIAEELRCLDIWRPGTGKVGEFEDATRWMTFKPGVGLPGRVWAERAAHWIPDVQHDAGFPRSSAADKAGFHASVSFPIVLRGEVLGVMEFFSPEIREPDEELIDMMSSIGSQIGQFMERKQAEEDQRMSEARKTAIVESALDCIITMNHLGYVLEFNPAAEETFGRKREDVIGKELAALIIPKQLRDAHRKGLLNYLETGDGPVIGNRIEITALRSDGTEFPVELAVQRVDVPGAPIFSGYLRDITERRESEIERLRLLEAEQRARSEAEQASRRLSQLQRITDAALSHLSVDELLEELLKRITETLGSEMTAILLTREEAQDLTVRAAQGLKTKIEKIPPVPIGEQVAGIVAGSGRPLIVDDLDDSEFEAPIIRSEGMRSLMAAPLLIENRAIGVLITGATDPGHFSDEELSLLQLAADRIAAPIQNASLFEREHQIATQLQRSLLPMKLPDIEGIEVCERYVPGGSGLAVGGDWYDVLELPNNKVGFVIGDVVGKGIRAASVMGQLRNSLRAFALEGASPEIVVERVNRLTESFDRSTMATMIYCVYDTASGELVIANAGHPPPLILDNDGARYFKGTSNIPLGVMPDEIYESQTTKLEPGQKVMLYTDGLVEEPGESIDEGLERLRSAVENAPSKLGDVCDHVLEAVFEQRERSDDVAILVFQPQPAAE